MPAATMLSPPPELSIVIPAFNEEQRLPRTLAELERAMGKHPGGVEVIVVDDGSSDATVAAPAPAIRTSGQPSPSPSARGTPRTAIVSRPACCPRANAA